MDWIAAVLVFVSLLLFLSAALGRRRREGEPPLIKGYLPFLGHAFEFGQDALKLLTKLQNKHGDVFTVLLAGKYITFVMDPHMYPAVVKHGRQLDFHEFSDQMAPASFGYPPMRKFSGMGEQVQRSFRLLHGDHLPALSKTMLRNLLQVMKHHFRSDQGPGAWQESGLYEFCHRIMFEVSLVTIYGHQIDTREDLEQLRDKFEKFDSMFPLLVARVPIWLLRKTQTVRKELIKHFHPQRMAKWENPSEFIKHRSEILHQYNTLGDLEHAAYHFAVLWASVGNTIPAAFWVVYYLLSSPEALSTVRSEIKAVLGLEDKQLSFSEDFTLTHEQLEKLTYMESALNESLRLSTASMNIRVALEDFSLRLDAKKSFNMRKGDTIALYPQSMHMDPDIYPEPEVYKFDRFLEDGKPRMEFLKNNKRLHYYLMPFGSGSSMCPGRFFALAELKQLLCVLLLYSEIELLPHAPLKLDMSRSGLGILPPTKDVQMRFRACNFEPEE
uniref:Cytochrome P450 7B1 n=1 Tax=Denticeps clupeoides TaxID=299321 RepID=A0A8C4G042_9TELE